MVRGRELSAEKRAQMMILHKQKLSHRRIAEILNVSKSSIAKGLQRAKELGNPKSRTRTGRPRVNISSN